MSIGEARAAALFIFGLLEFDNPFFDGIDSYLTTACLCGLDLKLDANEIIQDLQVEHVVVDNEHLARMVQSLRRWLAAITRSGVVNFFEHMPRQDTLSVLVGDIRKTECLVGLLLWTRRYSLNTESSIVGTQLI